MILTYFKNKKGHPYGRWPSVTIQGGAS